MLLKDLSQGSEPYARLLRINRHLRPINNRLVEEAVCMSDAAIGYIRGNR
jgi:hypothetical protein